MNEIPAPDAVFVFIKISCKIFYNRLIRVENVDNSIEKNFSLRVITVLNEFCVEKKTPMCLDNSLFQSFKKLLFVALWFVPSQI